MNSIMNSIMTTAYYTVLKYIRKPLACAAFILAPIIITFTLTGSVDYKYTEGKNIIQSQSNIENIIINPKQEILSVNDKVSLASMLIFLFYGSILSSHSIIYDLKNGVNQRLKSSPLSTMENILGKTIGNISVMAIFAAVLLMIAKYAFNVNLNGNIFIIIAAFMLFLIIVNGFGIIVTAFARNIYLCALASFALNFFMTFPVFVGTFSPAKISGILGFINKLSMHNYVVKAIMGNVMQDRLMVRNSLIVLLIASIVVGGLSLIAGRKVLE